MRQPTGFGSDPSGEVGRWEAPSSHSDGGCVQTTATLPGQHGIAKSKLTRLDFNEADSARMKPISIRKL